MDTEQIYKIDNFLESKELKVFNYITEKNYNWELKNTSYDDSRLFWHKDLWQHMAPEARAHDIEHTIRDKMLALFNIKVETIELYMNGQTHSQCGKMHTDEKEEWDPNSEYITLVYYANKEWDPEWGGFTIIDNGQLHIIYPKPNSAVLFNSRTNHVALEPTVHCPSMRITLACKMKIIKE